MSDAPAVRMLDHFATLDDPRMERTRRHALLDILAIAVCAVICGADSWVEVEPFGSAKREWLGSFLALPNGIPSHDSFGRVFAALDPVQFKTDGELVDIDGKQLRRSHDAPTGMAALTLVSAWAGANRLALGQVAVAPGSNEIPAIPALLRTLALDGCVVTVDAIGCQREIATQITAQGADNVLALKVN